MLFFKKKKIDPYWTDWFPKIGVSTWQKTLRDNLEYCDEIDDMLEKGFDPEKAGKYIEKKYKSTFDRVQTELIRDSVRTAIKTTAKDGEPPIITIIGLELQYKHSPYSELLLPHLIEARKEIEEENAKQQAKEQADERKLRALVNTFSKTKNSHTSFYPTSSRSD